MPVVNLDRIFIPVTLEDILINSPIVRDISQNAEKRLNNESSIKTEAVKTLSKQKLVNKAQQMLVITYYEKLAISYPNKLAIAYPNKLAITYPTVKFHLPISNLDRLYIPITTEDILNIPTIIGNIRSLNRKRRRKKQVPFEQKASKRKKIRQKLWRKNKVKRLLKRITEGKFSKKYPFNSYPQNKLAITYPQDKLAITYPQNKLAIAYQQNRLAITYPQDKLAIAYPQDKLAITYPQDKLAIAYSQDKLAITYPQDKLAIAYSQDKLAIKYPQDKFAITYPQDKLALTYPRNKLAIKYPQNKLAITYPTPNIFLLNPKRVIINCSTSLIDKNVAQFAKQRQKILKFSRKAAVKSNINFRYKSVRHITKKTQSEAVKNGNLSVKNRFKYSSLLSPKQSHTLSTMSRIKMPPICKEIAHSHSTKTSFSNFSINESNLYVDKSLQTVTFSSNQNKHDLPYTIERFESPTNARKIALPSTENCSLILTSKAQSNSKNKKCFSLTNIIRNLTEKKSNKKIVLTSARNRVFLTASFLNATLSNNELTLTIRNSKKVHTIIGFIKKLLIRSPEARLIVTENQLAEKGKEFTISLQSPDIISILAKSVKNIKFNNFTSKLLKTNNRQKLTLPTSESNLALLNSQAKSLAKRLKLISVKENSIYINKALNKTKFYKPKSDRSPSKTKLLKTQTKSLNTLILNKLHSKNFLKLDSFGYAVSESKFALSHKRNKTPYKIKFIRCPSPFKKFTNAIRCKELRCKAKSNKTLPKEQTNTLEVQFRNILESSSDVSKKNVLDLTKQGLLNIFRIKHYIKSNVSNNENIASKKLDKKVRLPVNKTSKLSKTTQNNLPMIKDYVVLHEIPYNRFRQKNKNYSKNHGIVSNKLSKQSCSLWLDLNAKNKISKGCTKSLTKRTLDNFKNIKKHSNCKNKLRLSNKNKVLKNLIIKFVENETFCTKDYDSVQGDFFNEPFEEITKNSFDCYEKTVKYQSFKNIPPATVCRKVKVYSFLRVKQDNFENLREESKLKRMMNTSKEPETDKDNCTLL